MMHAERKARYQDRLATAFTVVVHAALGGLLLFNLSSSDALHAPQQTEVQPIAAEIIDEAALRAEMERIAAAERQRQQEEAARQAQLAQAARAAEAHRQEQLRHQQEEAEKRRLAEERKAEERRQAAEEARQEAVEAKRKAAAEAAADAKREAAEKAAEERRQAAAEAKRKAEEARRLAQELAAREFAASVIKPYVKRQWILPPVSQGGLSCELIITISGSGAVTGVKVARSSGDSLFDNSAVAAVRRASPLPMPGDAYQARYIAEQSLRIKFSPADAD